MKKYIKFFTTILFSVIFITNLKAASGTVSVNASSSKPVIGSTITVTVKISSSNTLGSWNLVIGYDNSKLKLTSGSTSHLGEFGDGKKKSVSYTYKFKAIGTGNAKIWVKDSTSVYDYKTEKTLSLSRGSTTVKIITQSELEASYSKNNNLSSLSIDGYKLSPNFKSNITEYKVEAGSNVEKITVNAKKADSKATVSGTGTINVTEGENKITVKVRAQNGSVKTYTILVNVIDPNPINVKYLDKDYIVVKRESNLKCPENYEKKTITINDQKVPAFYNEINKYTLVGLKDADGNIELFIYNNDTYQKYDELLLDQMKIIPLEMDKEFDGYKKEKLLINKNEYSALKLNDSELYIIHARNLEDGTDDYYMYDNKTNTMIRYNDDMLIPYKEELKKLNKLDKYEKIILLLSVETVIIFFTLICILISNSRKNKKRKKAKEEYLKKLEDERKKEEIDKKKETKKKKKNK